VDVDDRLADERFAVLADACCSGHEAAARGAVALLRRDFGIDDDMPAATAQRMVDAALDARLAQGNRLATALGPWRQRIATQVTATPGSTGSA